MPSEPLLSTDQRAFLESARRAVLATIAPDGHPRLVPICFVLDRRAAVLYTPIDDKPKRDDDPLALARVRDIAGRPAGHGPRRSLGRGLDATRLAARRGPRDAARAAVASGARRGRRGPPREIPAVRDAPTRASARSSGSTIERVTDWGCAASRSGVSDRGRPPPPSGAGSGSSSSPGGSRRR